MAAEDVEWKPVDYADLRKGDSVLIITRVEKDSPSREEIEAKLAEGYKPILRTGMTDRDTLIYRLEVIR